MKQNCQNVSNERENVKLTKCTWPKNETCKATYQWRKVSTGSIGVYVLLNMLIMVPSWIFIFGQAESGDKAIVPSANGERAVDGDSERDGHDGSVDGTTSSGDGVEAALLAGESQHMCYSQRTHIGNSPVSSWPPTQLWEHPYGLVRHRWWYRRLKIEHIWNVSQMEQVKTTYLACARVAQPPGNTSKHSYMVYRPRCWRGHIKIIPTNTSRTQNGNAYYGCDNVIWSIWKHKRHVRMLNQLTFEYRKQGEHQRDDGESPDDEVCAATYEAQCDLPNRATMRKSHKMDKPLHSTYIAQILFVSNGTLYWIQLSTPIIRRTRRTEV